MSSIRIYLGSLIYDQARQNCIMKEERVTFLGHKNIRCLHKKTIEITKAVSLTTKGDCIAGVSADKRNDLDREFEGKIVRPGMTVNLEIILAGITFSMHGFTQIGV